MAPFMFIVSSFLTTPGPFPFKFNTTAPPPPLIAPIIFQAARPLHWQYICNVQLHSIFVKKASPRIRWGLIASPGYSQCAGKHTGRSWAKTPHSQAQFPTACSFGNTRQYISMSCFTKNKFLTQLLFVRGRYFCRFEALWSPKELKGQIKNDVAKNGFPHRVGSESCYWWHQTFYTISITW